MRNELRNLNQLDVKLALSRYKKLRISHINNSQIKSGSVKNHGHKSIAGFSSRGGEIIRINEDFPFCCRVS